MVNANKIKNKQICSSCAYPDQLKVANPPKGRFSKQFSEKWTKYYEEAFSKSKIKFPNLNTKEINKILSLKRKGYDLKEIPNKFRKIFKKVITKSELKKLFEERKKAAKIAWSRIKHSYQKSDKSGKWILKDKKV